MNNKKNLTRNNDSPHELPHEPIYSYNTTSRCLLQYSFHVADAPTILHVDLAISNGQTLLSGLGLLADHLLALAGAAVVGDGGRCRA